MSKLGELQEEFALKLAKLIIYINESGYQVRLGHVMRCPDCSVGNRNSLHKLKLAADINLFKDGKYLVTSEEHLHFGNYWERELGGSWGGRFGDGNHYSLSYNGMR